MISTFYPMNDFGPVMKGLVIGGIGIFHVFTAQFAIGGGFLLCWFQWLAMRGDCPPAQRFLDGYFRVLVLWSFVIGALTGVGMWFTAVQVSPQTIGLLLDEFHWLWATEWTFFCLEVVAGYAAFRYGKLLNGRSRLTLLGLYTFAGWMSLFWINGILSFQLTPGAWLEHRSLWSGFFNPTFFPSLLYRTVASLTLGALVSLLVINFTAFSREEREMLVRRASVLLAPMLAMPVLGVWFIAVLPPDSREWVLGGSMAMTMMLNIAIGTSALIAVYAVVGLIRQRLYINGASAAVLCVLAFVATAGGEFVREGVRKPYTVREVLFSNAIHPEEVATLRRTGLTQLDPYPIRESLPAVDGAPHRQLLMGALSYRDQCSICHTLNGVNSLVGLTASWDTEMKRQNFSKLQHLKAFMPPFAGSPAELEALVQYVEWVQHDRPPTWTNAGGETAAAIEAQIAGWLDAAGTESDLRHREREAARD